MPRVLAASCLDCRNGLPKWQACLLWPPARRQVLAADHAGVNVFGLGRSVTYEHGLCVPHLRSLSCFMLVLLEQTLAVHREPDTINQV